MNDGAFKLRDRLRQERDALIAKFNAGGSVDALLHGLARAADHLLREVAESSGITRRATLSPSAATAGANSSPTPTSTS